jgi:hypothetical protein
LINSTMFNWKNVLLQKILPFHYSEWKATYQLINTLLNEPNLELQNVLTRKWYHNMISHL